MLKKKTSLSDKNPLNVIKKLGSKQRAILVIVAFALVGVIGTLITNAAQIVDEETVRLSNGKEIRLGQSAESLEQLLGSDLYKLSDRQYQYPGIDNPAIEVVMEIAENKVVAIHLADNPANFIKATGTKIGVSTETVRTEERGRSRALQGAMAQLREKGIVLEQSRSKQYLLTNPCNEDSQNTTVDLVSIAFKDYEHRVTEALGPKDCHDE